MLERTFCLHDFIRVKPVKPKDVGWPTPSPFTMRFVSQRLSDDQRAAIAGSGVYLISSNEPSEVVYLGQYKPMTGGIIETRWGRHLQTITGRGFNIGLGGQADPDRRRAAFLAAVDAPGLRCAIDHSYTYSRNERFRDTGYCTTPNRLRFACEKWGAFEAAVGKDLLHGFTFWLLRISCPTSPEVARTQVGVIEDRVLSHYRPICNSEYDHLLHHKLRRHNTVAALTQAIREAARAVTGEDIAHRIQLAG